jgi:hypothetical protein
MSKFVIKYFAQVFCTRYMATDGSPRVLATSHGYGTVFGVSQDHTTGGMTLEKSVTNLDQV